MNPPKRKTNKEFVLDSKNVHKDKYDYSLVNYINNKTKVNIICKEHGIFKQKPNDHLTGNGCPKCAKNFKLSKEDFIRESNIIHNNSFDYKQVEYVNNITKVKIICKEHGEFYKTPKEHRKGSGCQKCAKNYKLTTLDFIRKSNNTHNNLYDYSLVNYINSHTKVDIICKEHGIFKQKPHKHYQGNGCPNCRDSKGVIRICNFLKNLDIIYEREVMIKGCKSKNNIHLLFDFYIPSKNIYIEYDGEQHFRTVKSWGGAEGFKKVQLRDSMKNKFCETHNIKLYRISYKDNIEKTMNKIIF